MLFRERMNFWLLELVEFVCVLFEEMDCYLLYMVFLEFMKKFIIFIIFLFYRYFKCFLDFFVFKVGVIEGN